MTRAVAVAVAAVVALPSAAAQRDENARVRDRLVRGQKLFDDLEYRKAIRMLAPIPHDPAATREQRVRALELIALSYLILGEEQRAREAFQDLLGIDPGFQLRDDTGSPKVRKFFDDIKREYVPGFDPSAAADLEHAAPARATASKRAEIEVRVVAGAAGVKEVVVRWRRRGVLDYRDAPARRMDDDRWRARFTPPAATRPYVVEYYVEARNVAGGAVGRIGGPETPLALRVAAGVIERTPWYQRWYVLAGGAIALGVGVTLIATSGDDAPDGSLPPGTVELTP